jgi:hypothetical protein
MNGYGFQGAVDYAWVMALKKNRSYSAREGKLLQYPRGMGIEAVQCLHIPNLSD